MFSMLAYLPRAIMIGAVLSLTAACSDKTATTPAESTKTPATKVAHPAADTVLTNGKVYTVNDEQPWAESVAIRGDEIVYVGDAAGAAAYVDENTRSIDLGGKMVMPGFVDAHSHAVAGGLIMQGVDLQSDSIDEILERIKAEVASNSGDIILGYGIRFNPWTDGYPNAAMLDEIEAERPVYLWAISGHAAWVNSKTLELAGITKDSPDTVPGYSFYERDEAGNPTGWIVELPAQMEVLGKILDVNAEFMQSGVELWLERFSAAGITSVQDLGIQGMTQEEGFQMFTALAEAGQLPLRLQGVYYWNDGKEDPVANVQALRGQFTHPLVQIGKIKINADGGDDSKNALYVDGYADDPELDPDPIIPADIINDAVARGDALGIDSVCHCFGDGAVRIMLDAVEAAIESNGPRDRRMVVTHGVSVHPDDIPRFADLNVIYDSSGAWMSYDPALQNISNQRIGEQRTQETFPTGKIVAAGGRFSLGSDWPVSGYISEYRPLAAIETAVTRTLDGRKDVPPLGGADAGVSVEYAIRAATINAAYNMNRDTEIGSLEVGKKADVIVLSENLLEIDTNDISEVSVLYTFMGGQLTHKAE
jgi:predicted amidohydrolase YtcJ